MPPRVTTASYGNKQTVSTSVRNGSDVLPRLSDRRIRTNRSNSETSHRYDSPFPNTDLACARTRVEISELKPDRSDLNRHLLGYSSPRVPSPPSVDGQPTDTATRCRARWMHNKRVTYHVLHRICSPNRTAVVWIAWKSLATMYLD